MIRLIRILSSSMILLGISLLVAVGALYAYGAYERYRFEHTMAMQEVAEAALGVNILEGAHASSPSEETEAAEALLGIDGLEGVGGGSLSDETEPAEASSSARNAVQEPANSNVEQAKRMPPATWIRIPKIEVDSRVVEAPVAKGEWQVPKFVVGHLEGTANPREGGNVALSGHVESIASGNVFSRLKEVSIGDEVILVAGDDILTYTVAEIKVVKYDDLTIVMPTTDEVLTLITCTGTWNPLIGGYTERLIVIAKPTDAE